jgi:FtsP/CotA-like multicopper oxidase with cupredoxin domain
MCLLWVLGAIFLGANQVLAVPLLNPGVDYTVANYAYSPTYIKKFVDSLPGIDTANNLSQQIPRAIADTATFPGCDYYEIALVEYHEKMHSSLPAGGTKLRGYVQEVNGVAVTAPHYLGPMILATKNRPVRIKFTNRLPAVSAGGNLFLPVDDTIMGAGMGPDGMNSYTQNRAAIHLHGGIPPWISDGTPHQWITPATEVGPYLKGISQKNVPDMWYDSTTGYVISGCAGQLTCATANATIDPAGVSTLYWTNQQSGRLMFYHDHAYGLTRLNVYAGEAAGYLVVDPTEETSLAAAGVPGTIVTNPTTGAIVSQDLAHLIPLVIQDKTFVNTAVAAHTPTDPLDTDPLWQTANWGGEGNLWFPHVYVPNQDPSVLSGANPLGRWDYGPWFWPIFPAASPYPPLVSAVPEAFMDTPVVNGTAYPNYTVQPTKYRLRILNASNDRMLNLQLYVADPTGHAIDATGADVAVGTGFGTEVKMVAATLGTVCTTPTSNIPAGCFPPSWAVQTPGMIPDILDTRPGGVPDPALRGPAMIQIGSEGGVLPGPALLLNTPVGYEENKRNIVVLNVAEKTLFMAPAERADVIVDFSNFAGKTIILYNDSPAPVPAGDPRYDLYTGDQDMSATAGVNAQGGPPSTLPGYGPNTRTILQFRVTGSGGIAPVDDYDATPTGVYAKLQNAATGLPAIFKASQEVPVVPESAYNAIGYTGGSTVDTLARIMNLSLTFTPYGSTTPITMMMKNKTIQELFDSQGRMNASLGVELPFTNAGNQTTVPLGYIDPTTETVKPGEIQLWKITHNGVDTHVIHFHLVNVQVVNRVGWDGMIRMTDPNELGWKESVRMNPLEDCIVAVKARVPTYPFPVPNSIRLLNPAMPENSTFSSFDPLTGGPITVTNAMTNFGHEYVWHCHILGHEENDMMRPLVLNTDQLLYVANAGTGVWQWDMGTWSQITPNAPTSMVASGSILYASFTGNGIYKWDGSSWTQLTPGNPNMMVTSGANLYASFAGNGIYKHDGTAWTQLTPGNPNMMVTSGANLYASFAGNGIYKHDGTAWTQLTLGNPNMMVTSGANLYASFAGNGIYKHDGTAWTQLTPGNPNMMVTSGANLYASFAGNGIYKHDGTAWTQLTPGNPNLMLIAGANLYATFTGNGIFKWDGTAWAQIHPNVPANMVVSGSALYADYTGNGIWKWEAGVWTQLTPTDPLVMVAGF